MVTQAIVAVRVLQRVSHCEINAPGIRQCVELPNIVGVINDVRVVLRIIEDQVLDEEFNVPDSAPTVLQIE